MRTRIVTSGIAASAAVVVLGLAAPAMAAGDGVGGTGTTLEALEEEVVSEDASAEDDTSTVSQLLDDVDRATETTEDVVDEIASAGPEPVADTVDTTTDAVTDTTDDATDLVDETLGSTTDVQDPIGDPDPDPADGSEGDKDNRGAGDQPIAAPAPTEPAGTGGAPDGQLVADGGISTSGPARVALDGFRRTPAAQEVAVTEDALFEPEPMYAPPTTRDVVEPTVTAAPLASLRTVAVEILVATALLVLATGGLLAELGPERT